MVDDYNKPFRWTGIPLPVIVSALKPFTKPAHLPTHTAPGKHLSIRKLIKLWPTYMAAQQMLLCPTVGGKLSAIISCTKYLAPSASSHIRDTHQMQSTATDVGTNCRSQQFKHRLMVEPLLCHWLQTGWIVCLMDRKLVGESRKRMIFVDKLLSLTHTFSRMCYYWDPITQGTATHWCGTARMLIQHGGWKFWLQSKICICFDR